MNDQNPTLNLTLTLNEVNVILTALGEMPARIAVPVIDKLSQQGKEQLNPSAPPAAEKFEATEA